MSTNKRNRTLFHVNNIKLKMTTKDSACNQVLNNADEKLRYRIWNIEVNTSLPNLTERKIILVS